MPTNTSDPEPAAAPTPRDARLLRRARALRDNLRRRKGLPPPGGGEESET